MIEIYKIVNKISPPIMNNLFEFREEIHNTRHFQEINNTHKKTVKYDLETISYRSPFLWSILPLECKNANTLSSFKRQIKKWIPENCPCRICKPFIANIGFI